MKAAILPQEPGLVFQAGVVSLLVTQNVSLILALHNLRSNDTESRLYCPAVAVAMGEICKFVIWLGVAQRPAGFPAVTRWMIEQWTVASQRYDTLRMALPSILYVVQTNLLYFALGYLDPITYQLLGQLKTLASAGFMVALLGRRLKPLQWIALVVLTAGISAVQLASVPPARPENYANGSRTLYFLGVTAVIMASLTSGFAGVYLEKIFKTGMSREAVDDVEPGTQKSSSASHHLIDDLAAANLRLGFFSIPFAVTSSLATSCGPGASGCWTAAIKWPALAWFSVLNSAAGGIFVALTIKYLDNIIKSFAMTSSIVLAGLLGSASREARGAEWWIGVSAVLLSVWMYHIGQ